MIILGDPGPFAFSGMTGGVVYQMLTPEMGFTLEVLHSRLGRGAEVEITNIDGNDIWDIQTLLGEYILALQQTDQPEVAEKIEHLSMPQVVSARFVKVVPRPENGVNT